LTGSGVPNAGKEIPMSSAVIVFGMVLGLDSLLVGAGLGVLVRQPSHRIRLAVWFAVCDGLASWLGSTAGIARLGSGLHPTEWFTPAVLAGYAIYVFYLARRCRDAMRQSSSVGRLAFCVPIFLSLDNLVAGTPTSSALAPLTFGAISGAMALCGLACGATLGMRRGVPAWRLSGMLLFLAAVGLFLKETFLA
jgi:putative Mn2+ efflux pump MntP